MVEVLEKELGLMRRQDVLKREVEMRYDYTIGAAYRSIDRMNDGHINMHNLGAFLRQCGHFAPEPELLSIIRRIDTDGDARLNFAEWTDFMRSGAPKNCLPRPVPIPVPVMRPEPIYRSRSPLRESPLPRPIPVPAPVFHPEPIHRSPLREPLPAPVLVPSPRRSPYRSPVRDAIVAE